jgi:transposase
LSDANADFWTARWRRLLLPPADAEQRAQRLDRELDRFRRLLEDIAVIESDLERLLAQSPGQILTTLPGVATNRAAAFSAHTLPIEPWPRAGHLYSATVTGPRSSVHPI